MDCTSVPIELENVHGFYLSQFLKTLSHIAFLSPNIFLLVFHQLLDQILFFDILQDTRNDKSIPLHCDSSLPARSCFNITSLFSQQAAGKCPLFDYWYAEGSGRSQKRHISLKLDSLFQNLNQILSAFRRLKRSYRQACSQASSSRFFRMVLKRSSRDSWQERTKSPRISKYSTAKTGLPASM